MCFTCHRVVLHRWRLAPVSSDRPTPIGLCLRLCRSAVCRPPAVSACTDTRRLRLPSPAEYFKNGFTLYLNSGLSSSRNHYGQRVITRYVMFTNGTPNAGSGLIYLRLMIVVDSEYFTLREDLGILYADRRSCHTWRCSRISDSHLTCRFTVTSLLTSRPPQSRLLPSPLDDPPSDRYPPPPPLRRPAARPTW